MHKAFAVADHIGGIVPDPVTGRLYEWRMMLCTGITGYQTASGGQFEFGGIALLDVGTPVVRHEVPFQQWSSAGHVATRNPVLLETAGGKLRIWAAPDDGEEVNGTEIFVYESG